MFGSVRLRSSSLDATWPFPPIVPNNNKFKVPKCIDLRTYGYLKYEERQRDRQRERQRQRQRQGTETDRHRE